MEHQNDATQEASNTGTIAWRDFQGTGLLTRMSSSILRADTEIFLTEKLRYKFVANPGIIKPGPPSTVVV